MNTTRTARGKKLLAYLERTYKNGEARDNLTDALSDLLHAGIRADTLRDRVEQAEDHHTEETRATRAELEKLRQRAQTISQPEFWTLTNAEQADLWRHMNEARRASVRLDTSLTFQLIGLEGKRVEVVTTSGGTRRFWVGKSTGWTPIHLEIKTRTSSGGDPALKEYPSVRVIDQGPRA